MVQSFEVIRRNQSPLIYSLEQKGSRTFVREETSVTCWPPHAPLQRMSLSQSTHWLSHRWILSTARLWFWECSHEQDWRKLVLLGTHLLDGWLWWDTNNEPHDRPEEGGMNPSTRSRAEVAASLGFKAIGRAGKSSQALMFSVLISGEKPLA